MRIDYGELKRRIRLRELLESLVGQVQRAVEINSAALVNYRLVVRTMGVVTKQRRDVSACMLARMCTVALSASGGNVLDFWQAYSGKSLRDSAIEIVDQLKTSNRTGDN